MILAPIVRRRTDDQEDREETSHPIMGFRAAYVFDISQTDGKELPQIGVVEGDPREYLDSCAALPLRRVFPSNIPLTSHRRVGPPVVSEFSFYPANRRRRNSQLSRINWRTYVAMEFMWSSASEPGENTGIRLEKRHIISF
jgi:hypothetical protein